MTSEILNLRYNILKKCKKAIVQNGINMVKLPLVLYVLKHKISFHLPWLEKRRDTFHDEPNLLDVN